MNETSLRTYVQYISHCCHLKTMQDVSQKYCTIIFKPRAAPYLPVWYSFSKCLDCNRTLCARWPSLIFPQQCLDQARRCAQRRSTKTKQTLLREHVCRSRVQLSHTRLKEDSYVDGERDTFPWNELLWDESLCELPRWPTTPSVFVQGGALILGSLPPCQDPGESCRGGQTSPPFCPRVFCFWGKESSSDEQALSQK